MYRIAPLFALTVLAACDRSEPPAAPAPVEAAPVAKAPVPSLDGQWRLITPAALDLTIGGGRATMSSGCLRRGFTVTQDRNKVLFASAPAGSSNCGGSPSAAEETAFSALADANLAVFGKDGATATLTGPGGMLTLERR